MNKKLFGLAAAAVLTTVCSMTALAGEWQKSLKDGVESWWYDNQDGTYAKSGWSQIDGAWYYFDEAGWMLSNTTTPDGYQVGTSGAWIGNTATQQKKATTKPIEWDTSWDRTYPTGVLLRGGEVPEPAIRGACGGGFASEESDYQKEINGYMDAGIYSPSSMHLCLDFGFNADKVDWYKSQGYISPQYQLPENFYEVKPIGTTKNIYGDVYRDAITNCKAMSEDYYYTTDPYIPKFVLESCGETFETYYEVKKPSWMIFQENSTH